MNFNLILQSLKERKISATVFSLSLVLYVWLLASLLPFMKDLEISGLFEKYPKAVLNLLAGAANVDFFSPEGFFTVEFLALWLPVIVFGFTVAFATAIVAKEVDDGTMDLLLAQPVRRSTLITSRYLALIIFLLIYSAVTMGSHYLFAQAYDFSFKTKGLLATGVHFFLFMLAISTLSLLFSLILKERGQAIIFSVAFLIASHLLNALAEFSETLKDLRFLSIFKYYQPYETLTKGTYPVKASAIFLGITAISLILSLLIFQKKDISS